MPLVTMPREMGSLGKDVASAVAGQLGKLLVHQEIIETLASRMRLRKSHVVRFLEGKASIWDKMTADDTSLSIYAADEILRLAENNEVGVIRGWGATHLLNAVPHVLRVRVCAPEPVRIERMMQRLNTDDRAAVEKEIQLSDEAHSAITRRHFGVNWKDAEHYDLVLNTERLSVDACVSELMAVLKQPTFQETANSMQILHDLALGARIRAALRHDARTTTLNITVSATQGIVTLSGITETRTQAMNAADVAEKLDGVMRVVNTLKSTERSHYQMDG